ncbi:MAG: hypothetical protein LC708_04440, partial [Actinobacteria bacterium]|nr:hypothetical protein [Actinomycetota bacterium]
APWKVAPRLNALDVTPDGKYLYVGDAIRGATQGFIRKVDAETGAVTKIPYAAGATGGGGRIGGIWDVVMTSAGHALVYHLRDHPLVISNPIYRLSTATDGLSSGSLNASPFTNLVRSYNGDFVFISDAGGGGNLSIYSAAAGSVTKTFALQASVANAHTAARPDGKLFAVANPDTLVFDSTFAVAQKLAGQTGGVWFDPTNANRLWVASTATAKLTAYDTNTFGVTANVPIGTPLGPTSPLGAGVMTGSPDGRYVYVSVPGGVRQVDLFGQPGGLTLAGLPSSMAAGTPVNVTVTARDPATGALLPNFTGLVRLIATDANATLPADYFFTAADQGS